ncbi:isocitrate lyase/PEP mutase family protein [Verticiella sediminum]|nr:isocitrate lyase/PEP mutase family protein [Verticiella sediminum]
MQDTKDMTGAADAAQRRRRLRRALAAEAPLIVPGCYDVMSALLAQQAGFEAVVVSGFGVSASLLGLPDMELCTASETIQVCGNVAARVDMPVLADADDGYGNALNVMRTVQALEQRGVSAITLEDQVSPKRCPLLGEPPALVSIDEAEGKLRAALRARRDPELMIVARIDAHDEAEVLARARRYADTGVDAIKLVSPALRRLAFLDEVRHACGLPLFIAALGWAGRQAAGAFDGKVAVVTHPLMPLMSAAAAVQGNLLALREGRPLPQAPLALDALEHVLGLPGLHALEQAYLPRLDGTR